MSNNYWLVFWLVLWGSLLSACASQTSKPAVNSASATVRAEDLTAWQNAQQLIKQKKWAEAKTALGALAKTNANVAGVKINLIAVYCAQEQWSQAAQLLKQIPDVAQSATLLNLSGVVAEHSGQITQAEQYYLSALAYPQAPAEAQYNLALLYDIYWQDPQKALPYYEAYSKVRPEDKAVADWITEIKQKAKK
ncbi:MAG: hypothetical protein RL497_722 [Pseudomonadota bacterium]|jgi:tetratricopeptide (TPR) repeat protein